MNVKITLFFILIFHISNVKAQNSAIREYQLPKGFVEAVESKDSLFYVIGGFSEIDIRNEVIHALDTNNNFLKEYFDFVDFDAGKFDMFYRFNRLNDSLLFLTGEFFSSQHSYFDMVILGADGEVKYTPNSAGPKYWTLYKENFYFNEDSMHVVCAYDNHEQAPGNYDIITRKLQGNDITMVRNRRIHGNTPWHLRFISLQEEYVYYARRDTVTSWYELMVYNHCSQDEHKLLSFKGKMGHIHRKLFQN